MKLRTRLVAAALGAAAAWPAGAQPDRPPDWRSYGYDAGGGRYSPLTQITPSNVAKLQVAWTYHMAPAGSGAPAAGSPPAFSTTTPLVVGNRIFLGTPYGRVVALDATSGRELWAYTLPRGELAALRGLAYWNGDARHAPRVIVPTNRGRLIALETQTGAPAADFGETGVVDAKTPDILNGFPEGFYGFTAPPVIYRNLAIIGGRVQERPTKGPAGDVRALDLVTGKFVWTFHSVPRPGEAFAETWAGDSAAQRSGVNMWNMATVDAERGLVFLSFGAPAYDRQGGDRPGQNLFSDSVVAVDANTGKYLWHFQVVHHDIWDYDLPSPPTLVTVKRDGRSIPAVVAMGKTGIPFILNRLTGKPVFGVTEVQVPPSTVSGEAAWPTQPVPDKPGVVSRLSFDFSELADVTPEHRAICQALIDKGGLAPTKMFEPIRSDRPSIRFPGGEGGAEWAGGAFDPDRGVFVFTSNQLGYIEQLVKNDDGTWRATQQRFVDPKTQSPCQKPPWGELIGINVNTGDVAWRTPLGLTETFPAGKQNTGRPANGGPIVTAAGLTFIGGVDDSRFRAFDTRSGKELWTYKLDYSAHATPVTYRGADGRQYVAVVATGGSLLYSPAGGDSLVAFALPK